MLSGIERLIQKILPRRELEGFEPDQVVRETTLDHPVYSKKPRKPLKSQANESNNSRHRNNSNSSKRRTEFGQGPQPGKKAKRGGRNQASKSDKNFDNSVKRNSQGSEIHLRAKTEIKNKLVAIAELYKPTRISL